MRPVSTSTWRRCWPHTSTVFSTRLDSTSPNQRWLPQHFREIADIEAQFDAAPARSRERSRDHGLEI
jgi:hypothetical protein